MQEIDFSVYSKYNPLRTEQIATVVTFGSASVSQPAPQPAPHDTAQTATVPTSTNNIGPHTFGTTDDEDKDENDENDKNDGELDENDKNDGERDEEAGEETVHEREEEDGDENDEQGENAGDENGVNVDEREEEDGEENGEENGEQGDENVEQGDKLDDDYVSEEDDDDDDFNDRIFGSSGHQVSILENLQEKLGQIKTQIKSQASEQSNPQLYKTIAQALSQSVGDALLRKQYETTFYRLPVVIKELKSTPGKKPPHGLYYLNRHGHKVYLSKSQQSKWRNGQEIAGCIKGCSINEI